MADLAVSMNISEELTFLVAIADYSYFVVPGHILLFSSLKELIWDL
jgi:hypothetical protein